MLGHIDHKFDLRFEDDYAALLELWSMSDFFQATQVDKQFFYKMRQRPTSCLELFQILMDEFARRNMKRFWLQKSNPDVGLRALRHFPDARFVVIRRNLIDNVTSNLQNFQNNGEQVSLIRAIYSHVVHEKQLNRVQHLSRSIELTYEDLVRDTETEVRRVCKCIGIEFDPAMLNVKFQKNTSFRNASDRKSVLRRSEETLAKFYEFAFRLLPLPVFYGFSRLKQLFNPKQPDPFIPGTFSSLRRTTLEQVESDRSEHSLTV
jgi:hypothetical protein